MEHLKLIWLPTTITLVYPKCEVHEEGVVENEDIRNEYRHDNKSLTLNPNPIVKMRDHAFKGGTHTLVSSNIGSKKNILWEQKTSIRYRKTP